MKKHLVSYRFSGGYGCEWCIFDHIPQLSNINDVNDAISQIMIINKQLTGVSIISFFE